MGMMQTTNYKIETGKADDLIKQLEYFEDIENIMNALKVKFEINNSHNLKPEYYYNNVTDFDSNEFQKITDDLYGLLIKDIKEYIEKQEKTNKGGTGRYVASIGELGATAVGTVDAINEEVDDAVEVDDFEDEDYDVEEVVVEDDPFEFDDEIEDQDMTEEDIQEANVNETTSMDQDINSLDDNMVIDKIIDVTGSLVAVSTIGANGKEWHQVINGEVINPEKAVETFTLSDSFTIKIGNEEETVPAGTYKVENAIYNADGSPRSVRIEAGDKKLWLHLDSNGNVLKTDVIQNQNGQFSITNPTYDAIDIYGNNLGKLDKGDYYIYEVMYDSNGKDFAYRVSPDGEYEKWVYTNGNTTDGTVALYNETQVSESGTSSVSLFEENKGLFGLLGVLFVGLGATLVVRKKVKDKENAAYSDGDEYSNDTVVEDNISTGNYGVYDVKKNDQGIITEARISPNDSNDEYWVRCKMSVAVGTYRARLKADDGYQKLVEAKDTLNDELYENFKKFKIDFETVQGNIIDEHKTALEAIDKELCDLIEKCKKNIDQMEKNADTLDAILKRYLDRENLEIDDSYPRSILSIKPSWWPIENGDGDLHKIVKSVDIDGDGNINLTLSVYVSYFAPDSTNPAVKIEKRMDRPEETQIVDLSPGDDSI